MSASLAVDDPQVRERKPRPHQVEALDHVRAALNVGARAQIIMACGTGKTLIGRWHAERTGAAVTVVVLPSLSLVAQTLEEWRSVPGWPFEALITCSDRTTAYGERERVADGVVDGVDVVLHLRTVGGGGAGEVLSVCVYVDHAVDVFASVEVAPEAVLAQIVDTVLGIVNDDVAQRDRAVYGCRDVLALGGPL